MGDAFHDDAVALIARKGALTTQLRELDDAHATAKGDREGPSPFPARRHDLFGHQYLVDGLWYMYDRAEELTRAALHQVDVELEALGVFA